jgi:uracil-DNA glycosylase
MMSREDILLELELLPVWQLRHPIAGPEQATELTQPEQAIIQEAEMPSVSIRLIASEDGQWLFALKRQQTEAAETLLHNMLAAVAVKVGHDVAEAPIATIADFQPKVIVAMGESVAQQLLALNQPLVQLRGKAHMFNETPVIVTYSPDALLQNTSDKAHAWADLCLAKFTIANL